MNQEDLIWKYLDEACDAKEKATVEQQLATDPAFRKAFEERKRLSFALQSLEPEQPALRFTANVMESLPLLYQSLPAKQLLGPNWIKIFWGSISMLLISALGVGIFSPDPGISPSSFNNEIGKTITDITQQVFIYYKSALILLVLSSSYILLMMLDRRLEKKG